MKLFISPHNDDETLFGAFTILRERPLVVVVTDSYVQQARGANITATQRRAETLAAADILGVKVEFLGFRDDQPLSGLAEKLGAYGQPEMVYAPAPEENGHHHHNLIGEAALPVFRSVTQYMTYTTAGKSIGVPVPFELGWPLLKLRALGCYESQIAQPVGCAEHFLRAQHEYYAQ